MTDRALDTAQHESLSPEDAAAYWLVARDRGFRDADAGRFVAWLSASEANAAALARAERTWASFDAEPDVLLQSMRAAALRARPDPQPLRRGMMAATAAAAVILCVFFGWHELAPTRGGLSRPSSMVAETGPLPHYATAVGVRSTLRLADGSQVTLDSDSAVEVAFTPARRDIRLLRGQAFFAVAHDADHPFTVDAGGRIVTDLGTAFDVRNDPRSVYVVLAKGSVSVSQAIGRGAPIRLSPGQSFQATPGQPGVVRTVDVAQALAWRSGYLEFRDEPLAKAVAEMNRYGGPRVSIGDPGIRSLRVSGRFRIGDPVRFSRALAEVYPVRVVSASGRGVELVRR